MTQDPELVIRVVAKHFGVKRTDIMGPVKYRSLARARHWVMWMLRTHCVMSYPQIGVLMNRDHSTVIHSVRVAEAFIKADPEDAARLQGEFLRAIDGIAQGAQLAPCGTCGVSTRNQTQRCGPCWEVEHRLPAYVRGLHGVDHLQAVITKELARRALVNGTVVCTTVEDETAWREEPSGW